VNLFEDAYTQYDELEGLFYEVLKEKNLSWFGTLINNVNGDDSAPLLSSSKKPYRDLILANSISVFDFRTYVLSRQCELLAQKGRITDISRKVATFLCAFGRRLREVEVSQTKPHGSKVLISQRPHYHYFLSNHGSIHLHSALSSSVISGLPDLPSSDLNSMHSMLRRANFWSLPVVKYRFISTRGMFPSI
jgi:hypothetical protein